MEEEALSSFAQLLGFQWPQLLGLATGLMLFVELLKSLVKWFTGDRIWIAAVPLSAIFCWQVFGTEGFGKFVTATVLVIGIAMGGNLFIKKMMHKVGTPPTP